MLTAAGIWISADVERRHREERRRRWDPMILDYLCSESDEASRSAVRALSESVPLRDRRAFAEFLVSYLEELKGEDAERLRALLVELGYAEESVQALRSRNQWARAFAARLLGEMRATSAIDALAVAIADASQLVSYSAAHALLTIGTEASIQAVAEAIGRRVSWPAGRIRELLPLGGSSLAEHLHVMLKGRKLDEATTVLLVELMGLIKYLPAEETLLDLIRQRPSVEIRVSVIRSLGHLGVPAAVPFALEGLEDPDWVVRSQCASALGRIGDPGAVPGLSRALGDNDYWVRYNAAVALRELGRPGRSALLAATGSGGPAEVIAREVLSAGEAA
jgi:HEAT repeat protein